MTFSLLMKLLSRLGITKNLQNPGTLSPPFEAAGLCFLPFFFLLLYQVIIWTFVMVHASSIFPAWVT